MKKAKNLIHTITVPALTPGAITVYDVEANSLRNLRKYVPFRSMHVVNINVTANAEIMFDYSPNRKIICLYNGIKDIRDQPFSAFSVRNTHATDTIVAGDIIIELETY